MSNTTTLARGFRLTRRDGLALAFTDHDRDLTVGGVTYGARAALTPSEAAASLGMAADDQQISGGLSSAAITEADIAAGLYDGARVEVVEIDWQAGTARALATYTVGEVTRTESAFTAELRGITGRLARVRGRYCLATCDAALGDARCGVDLAGWREAGTVAAVLGEAEVTVSGIGAAAGRYAAGLLTWTSGANAGQVQEVRAHLDARILLWSPPAYDMAAGDGFTVTAGCDKTWNTCKTRFGNGLNFRGFPTVATSDALKYAVPGQGGYDGRSRNAL